MLAIQAFEKLPKPSPGAFIHRMFEVDKKNTLEKRPILNCRPLNKFIPVEHFKQEGLRTVKELLQPGDYMTSVDLRHAYVHVGLATQERDLFTFQYDQQWYRYRVMPFGLNLAPRVFTKIVKAAASLVRKLGVRIVIYLDDSLIMAKTKELCLRHTALWIRILQMLGFVINLPKSALEPSQLRDFLGFLVNSVVMSFALPDAKRGQILAHCQRYLSPGANHPYSARELARTMGMLTATSECCEGSKIHTFYIHNDLLNAKVQGWDGSVALSAEALKELKWWCRALQHFQEKAILSALPDLPALIRSDASGLGWGAVLYLNGKQHSLAQGLWSWDETNQSNNVREMAAAVCALEHFLPAVAKPGVPHTLHIQSDNTTAIATILKMGNLHSLALNKLLVATRVAELRRIYSTVVVPCFIQGELNSTADELSRKTFTLADARLHPSLFEAINRLLGPLEIDLFASEATAQLPTYCSWAIQKAAWRIDAMSFKWNDLNGLWVNPPFSLIARCLQKVSAESVPRVAIVAPVWTAQPWWPLLIQSMVAWPMILPRGPNTFLLPSQAKQVDNNPVWTTAVWLISGDDSLSKAFRSLWWTGAWPRGRTLKVMTPLGGSGPSGVETMTAASTLLTTIEDCLSLLN